jgi:hypothetical protein
MREPSVCENWLDVEEREPTTSTECCLRELHSAPKLSKKNGTSLVRISLIKNNRSIKSLLRSNLFKLFSVPSSEITGLRVPHCGQQLSTLVSKLGVGRSSNKKCQRNYLPLCQRLGYRICVSCDTGSSRFIYHQQLVNQIKFSCLFSLSIYRILLLTSILK